MKGIHVDPLTRTTRAEAGLTPGEFVCEIEPFGLLTTTGTVAGTVLSGLRFTGYRKGRPGWQALSPGGRDPFSGLLLYSLTPSLASQHNHFFALRDALLLKAKPLARFI